MCSLPVIVPSWVIPGSAQENADFLRGRVRGIMLCCFESSPRLPSPLPACADGLDWHMHLPLDLPWMSGGKAAAGAALRVMEQASHLLDEFSLAVLHMPPRHDPRLLEDFVQSWQDAGLSAENLVLENVPDSRPDAVVRLLETGNGLRLCLDLAHLVLSSNLCPESLKPWLDLSRFAAMVHWSAPVRGRDGHAPLTALAPQLCSLYRQFLAVTERAVHVVEVFAWDGVVSSWNRLAGWRSGLCTNGRGEQAGEGGQFETAYR